MFEDLREDCLQKRSEQILHHPFHLLSWMTQAHRRHLLLPRRYIRRRFSNFAEDRTDHIGRRCSELKRESHLGHFEKFHQKVWVLRRHSLSFSFDHKWTRVPRFWSYCWVEPIKWQREHKASRLFKQPPAATICCGYSRRAEIQRQRGIQEQTNHVYSIGRMGVRSPRHIQISIWCIYSTLKLGLSWRRPSCQK